jgi:hypothetical protein
MDARQLKRDDEWLDDHMEELVAQYPGKVVAIHADKESMTSSPSVSQR